MCRCALHLEQQCSWAFPNHPSRSEQLAGSETGAGGSRIFVTGVRRRMAVCPRWRGLRSVAGECAGGAVEGDGAGGMTPGAVL